MTVELRIGKKRLLVLAIRKAIGDLVGLLLGPITEAIGVAWLVSGGPLCAVEVLPAHRA